MTLKPDDLSNGMEKIADEIAKHCRHGKQITSLTNNALACGQFYGESVKERVQRGLHGTAAAISILRASDKESHVDVAKKLLIYTKNHETYDPQNSDDNLNTIKQSEILAALNDLAGDLQYASDLMDRLLNAQDAYSGSWSYFLDEKTSSKVATCYALLALHNKISPEKLLESKKYLWKNQHDLLEKSKASDIYAIAINQWC